MKHLDNNQIIKITDILKQLLADETILYLKARNAHWNVEGRDFQTIHLYFETLYNELQLVIDEVAEKIRTKDVYAPATMSEYLQLTHLSENPIINHDSLSYIKDLLNDYEIIIGFLNQSILEIEDLNDVSTSDYLVGLLEQHQKTAWMLRSHLK
ncbi:Dps family protein [Faecalibacter rhinopitheci]|uniref:DNA starvation/stationary phase protection protein n=1 Tax=Faecalibacter rhinopitheci TaxID=2779678 RepID=A0A8J7FYU2_9FLAO|nr:DNA starvation/stationary phase protection protein [Faecalibacter rhinopitheci]MBF0598173.1 DNA starvation/stationary phase protection protein [Faecalibacter rhinopitheci]